MAEAPSAIGGPKQQEIVAWGEAVPSLTPPIFQLIRADLVSGSGSEYPQEEGLYLLAVRTT